MICFPHKLNIVLEGEITFRFFSNALRGTAWPLHFKFASYAYVSKKLIDIDAGHLSPPSIEVVDIIPANILVPPRQVVGRLVTRPSHFPVFYCVTIL